MANEEDDPVIQEIHVYLAKSLAERLYLFQYPVHRASMTYDDIPHLSAKIKSKQQKQRGADCTERGRGLRGETSTYCSKLMDKQTFCSSQTTSNTSRYTAALYRQGSSGVENTELVKSPSEYLLMLMPPSQEEEKDKPVAPSNVLSMAPLRTLPLAGQIKILMKNVKVMPLANLMSLLGPSIDSVAVLRGFQKVAMLVQGNWVVKSDILYPKDSSSPHSGVPAEVLCRGRDFVTWKFTQIRWVVRKEVATVTKLCTGDVKDFLEHVAMVRIDKGRGVHQKAPDAVQRQHLLWTGIRAKLENVYDLVKETRPKKPDAQSGPAGLVSGEQRIQVAKTKARQNHALLEGELQRRKERLRAPAVPPGVRIKEEPVSEEGEDDDED
ncbi:DNA-directed RNA polymerase III subunit RPC5 [Saguinus oedipus]|uniref:DNA-directed RNA polymerase III subunit RPC5 n=1 Tax=Saguinus oedipus TaxID=9490 RepID=A0ABQ9THH1_SAGOE|nr:DNA-directed RNA polymerase III subunit RPC5 [Saguinus oedipus]